MKYTPISFKTDYSLLKSIIKVKDIIEFSKKNDSFYAGVLDESPYAIMDFYDKCKKNNLKCIFGMIVKIGDNKIYLYIKDHDGYQNLIKINDLVQDKKLTIDSLFQYNKGLICVLPYESYKFLNRFKPIFPVYLGYKSDSELKNAIQISKNVVFINEISCFKKDDLSLLKVIYKIGNADYQKDDNYVLEASEFDKKTIEDFAKEANLDIETEGTFIPKFCKTEEDSWKLLYTLSKKGLIKRLNGKVSKVYVDRLNHELKVIKNMGFVDYFLIVYDYVKFAKKNEIYEGTRGSAAGALVAYTLGISDVDPIKYDLLFERFLNPERVTMPDIDVDFEDTRRNDVIEYVRNKYGSDRVSLIVAYGTLAARAVLRDVAKVFDIDAGLVDQLCKKVDSKKTLKENLGNGELVSFIKENNLEKIYKISMKLEGLKKNTTIHAAGVVISSVPLLSIVPTYKTSDGILAGYTMEYLESLGLLKMDFLALKNLSTIHSMVDAIKKTHPTFDLRSIPLDDVKTYRLLASGNTDNVFQFDTPGMRNFLKKLVPENFDDLIAAIALFRPGPMQNIDEYIKRRKGLTKVTYLHPDLEAILKSTYGIIIYQEQIMQILSKMGGYSYAEADLIRRAMSKKKKEVMVNERIKFVEQSIKRGYDRKVAEDTYDLIVKFADYGFNKSHSVVYALLGYEMAYMKVNYSNEYQLNTLNTNLGSDAKIKDIIEDAKNKGLKIEKPSINRSDYQYKIEGNSIVLPLSSIKNISTSQSKIVIDNQPFTDYFDFFKKVYNRGLNKANIEDLIKAGALDEFGYSKNTLLENMDSAITYLELVANLDESLVTKPDVVLSSTPDKEYPDIEIYGFYISGHPASKFTDKSIMKIENASKNVGKRVTVAVLVDKVKVINTKKGEKMAFVDLSDETKSIEGVIFPSNNDIIDKLDMNGVNLLKCQVSKRNDEVQLVVESILENEKH